MSETYLYLTTTGHKTGRQHQIEIWYVEYDGRYYMVSEGRENAHWVRNLLAHPRVNFSVGTRENQGEVVPLTAAIAQPIDPAQQPEIAREVSSRMDAKYDWSDGLIVQLTPQMT